MKQHTTNYTDTFIEVAPDCPAAAGEMPPLKGDKKSVANLQFEMLFEHPYKYSSDDVLFHVYATRNNIAQADMQEAKEAFFSKGQPCFRASPLTKKYGWGVHSNAAGKIALYGSETAAYKKFGKDKHLQVVKAMRSAK